MLFTIKRNCEVTLIYEVEANSKAEAIAQVEKMGPEDALQYHVATSDDDSIEISTKLI